MNAFKKYSVLLATGGFAYMLIEILFRGRTHWSMGILGGICFVLIGLIDSFFTFECPLLFQMLLSTCLVTVLEYLSGILLNLYLKLNVWDYSDYAFNVHGQICLLFSFFWFLLSPLAILVDDWIRWKFFKETKPHYRL